MKKKLDAYRGKLSSEKIAEGMNAAAENARRLVADTEILLEAGRYPTAASIAILAIEEAGKSSILREIALAKTDEEASKVWRTYRSHTHKNALWIMPELVGAGARKLDEFKTIFAQGADHSYVLDQLKQIGFYTDCLGKAHWSKPEAVIDEDLARRLVQIAKIFAKKHRVTPKEIELWKKHMGPVWKRDSGWMKQALANWYAEMQQEGLYAKGPNEMEEFVRQSEGKP